MSDDDQELMDGCVSNLRVRNMLTLWGGVRASDLDKMACQYMQLNQSEMNGQRNGEGPLQPPNTVETLR